MLAQLKLKLRGEGLDSSMGSLFHGYLMGSIDPAFADYLHYQELHPFTSCIYRDGESGEWCWRLTTLNRQTYENLLLPMVEAPPKSIYLEHKQAEFAVTGIESRTSSLEELFLKASQPARLRLVTPTSFKSKGRTHIFPVIETLLSGVVAKLNAHSDSLKLSDEKILGHLLEEVYIRDYHLRTRSFSLEKVRIKGFVGSLDLWVAQDRSLLQLLSFLVAASEYTGFGIKTALGMGAVSLESRESR